jgi:Tol biopolymer transport system component
MLTGQQTFAGETVTDVIAAVVTREPDLALLPAQTPASARWLLSRCLQKDPRERFRDAADAAALLDAPVTAGSPAAAAKAAAPASKRPWAIAAVAVVIALGALAALALAYRGTDAPAVEPMAFQIDVADAPLPQAIALSPDGRRLVYLARNDGQPTFWVRTLDDLTPRVIPGVTGVNTFSWPFWSPDSRYIAFATRDGKLKKVDPNGGVVEVVADLAGAQFGGGSWSSNGAILFGSNDHGLRAVPAGGGPITDVTTREPHEIYHDCPWFLPDGQHFLYLAYSDSKPETRAIYLGELGSQSRTRLFASNSCAVYASGHILATRESSLFAWPFDPQKLILAGDAIPVAANISTFSGGEVGSFAVSDTGVLIFRQGADEGANRRLVWFDRNGKAGEPIGPPIRTSNIQLSPEGSRVAYAEALNDGPADVWVYDFSSGAKSRLTTDPGMDHTPVWSHDGRRIFYDSHRSGEAVVYERVADGAAPEQPLITPEKSVAHSPRAATPDGRFLLFGKSAGGPPWNLWLQPLSSNAPATQYLASKFDQGNPTVSPDGRWVAYATDESGTYEVVVQPLINPSAGRWQVSMNGGTSPRWGRGGRELYYLARNGDLMAVPVTAGATFESGSAVRLFKTPFGVITGGTPYDVMRDGERFLLSIATRDPEAQPMTAVVNWPEKLKR